MDKLDNNPDTMMVLAGVVISGIAALELYPAWKQAHSDNNDASAGGESQPTTEK